MTSILFNSSVVTLTSALDEIGVTTDRPYLDIEIVSSQYGRLFYERYWPYEGNLTLWDISYIIENFMRSKGIVILDDVSIKAFYEGRQEHAVSPLLLYCEALNEGNKAPDLDNEFITTQKYRRIAPDIPVFLFVYDKSLSVSSAFQVHCSYRIKDSSQVRRHDDILFILQKFQNIWLLEVSQSQIKKTVAASISLSESMIEIVDLDIICGKRMAHFVVDRSLACGHVFYFRNCFNCPDFINLAAVTTSKTEVNRSLAVYGSRAVFYDQRNERNYDVQTAPLVDSEAKFIDQLVSSHEVYKIIPESDDTFMSQLILITDSSCDIADDDDPNSIKYTWRYADNRLHRQLTESSLVRIFTYQFNSSYQ